MPFLRCVLCYCPIGGSSPPPLPLTFQSFSPLYPTGFHNIVCYFLFYHFIYVSLLSRYIILSFVLCTLVLKINLVSPILLLSLSLGFPPLYYWRFPSYTSEIGTTEGSGGTTHKLRLKSYWLHWQSFQSFRPTFFHA